MILIRPYYTTGGSVRSVIEITKLVANLCLFSHMFVFDKCSVQTGVLEELIPYLCTIERLMCEVEFLGGVLRKVLLTNALMWVNKTTASLPDC